MLSNIRISTLLTAGFSIVVAILIFTSVISLYGLNNAKSNFHEYRVLANSTNAAAQIQANLLQMQIEVLKFANSKGEASTTKYDELKKTVDALINEAKANLVHPEHSDYFQKIEKEVNEYHQTFISFKQASTHRNTLIENKLNPIGLKITKGAAEILSNAYQQENLPGTYHAAKLLKDVYAGRLYIYRYLQSSSDSDYKIAESEYAEKLPKAVNELFNDGLKDNRSRQLINETLVSKKQYLQTLQDIYSTKSELNRLFKQRLATIGPKILTTINELKNSLKNEQNKLGPIVEAETQQTVTLVIMASIISIIVSLLVSWFISRLVRRPIGGEPNEIAGIVKHIAAGDLRYQHTSDKPATGILKSVQNMTSDLKHMIGGVANISSDLGQQAEAVNKASNTSSIVIDTQREQATSIATAMHEMAASIQEVVQHAGQSAALSKEGSEEANNGKEKVNLSIAEINKLAGNLKEAVNVIKSLEANSTEIGSVIDVIKGISEQTNLLALNAAIEAARAGEQGRGFAVVADEVRTLAQKTSDSTNEIQNMVSALQEGTLNAVNVMEESFRQAEITVEQSREIEEALDHTNDAIDKIADMNVQVASAVEQQSAVADEIARNIEEITVGFDQTSQEAVHTSQLSDDVLKLSKQLQEQVSGFKL